jgi:hypothetical protein
MAKKNTRVSKPATRQVDVTPKVKSFPFLLLGIFFLLLHLYLSFIPDVDRGWGLNFVSFFSPITILLFYTVLVAVMIPPVNKLLVNFFLSFSRQKFLSVLHTYRFVVYILIAIAFGFLFYKLQLKYVFLGDLDIRTKQIENGEMIYDEYLTMLMFNHLYVWLHANFEWSGIQMVKIFSNIIGGLFILVSLFTADAIAKKFLQKLAYFILSTLSLAALMQFCGYLEIYALALLMLQLYVYLCILHLKGKLNIIFPVLLFFLAVGVHSMLVCMLPSLVFLFYRSVLWRFPLFRKKTTFVILAILLIPLIYYGFTHFAARVMLPFSENEKGVMTVFSIVHFKEFINSQLLAGGFVFVVWVASLFFLLFNKIKFTAFHWFFLIASLSMTGLLFVFNAARGSGDWDIFSFGAIISNAMTAFVLLDLHNNGLVKNIKYGVCMMAVFAIMHTSFWIATNVSDNSIGWFEKAIETDPASYYKGSFSNESLLCAVFSANGLNEKAMEYGKLSYIRHRNDPRTGFNYADQLIKNDQLKEATVVYEGLISNFPWYPMTYPKLINIYYEAENYDALYQLLLKFQAAYTQNPDVFNSRLPKENIDSYFDVLNQFQAQMRR